jgi:uncharacterized pyridoxamine 5'-phosphate oxidase family protein
MAQALKAAPLGKDLKVLVARILDENRDMAIATLRPDGWPQTTMVGFVHDDLTLFFVVARSSQKFRNLALDPRASIAIGRHGSEAMVVRGLSMAVRVEEVTEPDDIRRLNALIWERYPNIAVFAPREANSVVFRAKPQVISVVDDASGLATSATFDVTAQADLVPHRAAS